MPETVTKLELKGKTIKSWMTMNTKKPNVTLMRGILLLLFRPTSVGSVTFLAMNLVFIANQRKTKFVNFKQHTCVSIYVIAYLYH